MGKNVTDAQVARAFGWIRRGKTPGEWDWYSSDHLADWEPGGVPEFTTSLDDIVGEISKHPKLARKVKGDCVDLWDAQEICRSAMGYIKARKSYLKP